MEDIVIAGAGNFGREVEWLISRINDASETKKWNFLGYADDTMEIGTPRGNSKIIYHIDDLANIDRKINVVISVAWAEGRKQIYDKLKGNENISFPNIVDPNALLGDVKFGMGNIICAGVIGTINIKINNFNIVNLSSTIGHDTVLNDFITIYPSVNVSGNVTIGNVVEVGTGSQIIEKKSICDNVVIGAGGVVVKSIEESGTYVGVPVQKIK